MSDQVQALIRNVLMAVGTFAATKGWIGADTVVGLVGALMTAVGFVWSWTHVGTIAK